MSTQSTTHHSQFKQITIIGVGLIGGSLGLAIKQRFRGVTITGVDKPSVLKKALRRGAIDRTAPNLNRAIWQADLVILASPTREILRLIRTVARHAFLRTLFTDVGSVKSAIVERASKYFPGGNFVGGHPMAGVELSGIEAAHPLLFENAVYVLTPTRRTRKRRLQQLGKFLQQLGARVVVLDAATHDKVAAALSHLPQLTAVALMNAAARRHPQARKRLELAAGGFRDLTRIASSPFEVWQDIVELNSEEIDRAIRLMVNELERYRSLLKNKKLSQLAGHFDNARKLRNAIPRNMKGFLHTLSDVYVYVQDRPGVLATMTGALAKARVNIKDMELLKIREGSGGTFRLSFDSKEVAHKAAKILRRKGFEVEE
ncbi:MAG: prephenate dehydrogenase/arogenate dehydrogenase family protein [Bacteroidota bacterium]